MTEASVPANQPQQDVSGPDGSDVPVDPHPHRHLRMTQGMVLLALAVCVALAWWVGKVFDVPAYRGYEASLLQQPGVGGKILAILLAATVLVVGTVVGQLLAGRWWLFAGLFGAAAGWVALSARGGPSQYVYLHAADAGTGRAVFLMLVLELLMLSAVVGAIWFTLVRRAEAATAAGEGGEEPKQEGSPTGSAASDSDTAGASELSSGRLTGARAQAVALQAVLMAITVMIFVQSDSKQGVLIGVLLASFIGTSLAEHWFKEEKAGAWYWAGPMLVGVVGYLLNQFTAADVIATGQLRGTFAALARPVPLDYAGMGTVGAVLGYWIGAEHPQLAVGLSVLWPRSDGRGPGQSAEGRVRPAAAGADNGQAPD